MSDLVWLGNHIVPRWEALLVVLGGGLLLIAATILVLGTVTYAVDRVIRIGLKRFGERR